MISEHYDEFSNSLRLLAIVFNFKLPLEVILTYFDTLKSYPQSEVQEALFQCQQEEEFFPKPATIIRWIKHRRATKEPTPFNKECKNCQGTGFETTYMELDRKKLYQLKFQTLKEVGTTQDAIDKNILKYVTREDYDNKPNCFSFAKKCICRS